MFTTGHRQANGPQATERAGKSLHRTPATIWPHLRAEIAAAVRAGRSVAQTAREYGCTGDCVLELAWRADRQEIKARLERLEDAVRLAMGRAA